MTENHQQNLDNIPESKTARWAYRLSRIPFLGLAVYCLLAPIALYRIGNKGQTGFHLLRRGLILGILYFVLLTVLPYACLVLWAGLPNECYPLITKYCAHGKYVEYFKDGKVSAEKHYWFGKKNGKWKEWNTDGSLRTETDYVNDLYDGKMIRYGGRYYLNDLGETIKWSEMYKQDVQPYSEYTYKKGIRHGQAVIVDGGFGARPYVLIKSEMAYSNGKLHGKLISWDVGWGKKNGETNYENGKKHGKSWYQDIESKTESVYKNDELHGKYTTWNWNGKKTSEGEFKDGHKIGTWSYWDGKDKIKRVEIYSNEGDYLKTIEYKDGKPVEEFND